jgi:hypothetical protein
LALIGEFDRVGDKIADHLNEAVRIAHQHLGILCKRSNGRKLPNIQKDEP